MIRCRGLGLVALMLLAAVLNVSGCVPMPGEKVLVDVAGEYLGLVDQRVAVMVAADGYMLHSYPEAPIRLSKSITSRIAQHVPGVVTTIPEQVARFQEANPYWMNMRYGELAEKMGVDKIVLVDLVEYQTHEPGNAHLWQGLITANVGVIDANAPDPDNFIYYKTVGARFPEESDIGIIDTDDDTIQLGMVVLFARKAGGLFYDHQIEVDK
jgi:hypothetical protein